MKHLNNCTCSACNAPSIHENEINLHVHEQENSRREFLKSTSRLGLGTALFSAPIAASALNQEESAYKSKSMENNRSSNCEVLHTMKNWAKVEDGIVINIVVGYENPGGYIEYSPTGQFRKTYAMIGGTYNKDLDIFSDPKPYESWNLDENHNWQPPSPKSVS